MEYEELGPLNQDEMEIARTRIQELHPLNETPIEQILPNLFCCAKFCRTKKGDHQLVHEDDEEIVEIN